MLGDPNKYLLLWRQCYFFYGDVTTVGEENTCLANICSRKHKYTSTNTQTQAHKLGHVPRDPTHIHRYSAFLGTHSRKKGQKKMGCYLCGCSQGWVFVVGCLGLLWTTERSEGVSPSVSAGVLGRMLSPTFHLYRDWQPLAIVLADTMFNYLPLVTLLLHMIWRSTPVPWC